MFLSAAREHLDSKSPKYLNRIQLQLQCRLSTTRGPTHYTQSPLKNRRFIITDLSHTYRNSLTLLLLCCQTGGCDWPRGSR